MASVATPLLVLGAGQLAATPDWAVPPIVLVVVVSPVAILITTSALVLAPRSARILRTYAWREYICSYPPFGGRRDFLIALHLPTGEEVMLHTTPFRCDLRHKQNAYPDRIWFAGDPACGGVLSPVGGHFPVRAVNPALWEEPSADVQTADARAEAAGLARDGRYLRRWF